MKKLLSLILVIVFCIGFVPSASADDGYVGKILIETYPDASTGFNQLPVVGQKTSDFYAKTSTVGCVVTSTTLVGAGATVENKDYTLQVVVTAQAVNVYFDGNTTAYINNVAANVTVNDSQTVTVSRVITPQLLAPTIWHHPSTETHAAGETFSFAASASPYYDSYQWYIQAPYGDKFTAEQFESAYSAVTVSVIDHGSSTTCNIHNVPADFNDWMVYCVFTGEGGAATTNKASIKVKGASSNVAVVGTDGKVTDGIEIVETPNPTSSYEIVETPEPSYEIVETPEPTEEIIPETTPEPAAKKGMPGAVKWILGIVGGIVVLGGAVIGIQYLKDKKRRKRRAKMASSGKSDYRGRH